MEIEKLRQLIAFYDYKTLSATSEAMHISQPTLTRAMQNIEDELGVKLFERTKNSISLTDTGLYAVRKARRFISEHDEMINSIKLYDESKRTISIGSIAPGPLWTILPELVDRFPSKMIRSEVKPAETLVNGLLSENYKEIILTEDISNTVNDKKVKATEWGEEYLYVSLPINHRLAGKDKIKWKDIDGESAIIFSDTGMWGKIHMNSMPNSKIIVQSDRVLLDEIIQNSSLLSFMSNLSMEHFSKPKNRVFVRIDEENAKVKYYIHSLQN